MKKREAYTARPVKAAVRTERKSLWALTASVFGRVCMGIGAFVLIMCVYLFVAFSALEGEAVAPELPEEIVLYLKLDEPVYDVTPVSGLFNPFEEAAPTLQQVIDALDAGAQDDRVQGFYFHLGDGSFNITQAQEVRAAVKRFRESGKFTKIYSSSYGGSMDGLARMYFASAFDERWMQPLGIVSIAGLRAEVPFFKGVLDKIGVSPDFYQRKDYKTAYESFTQSEMSAANRESLTDVVESIRDVVMADMPADLGLEPARFKALVDKGLLTSKESLEAGLITHSDYADLLLSQLRQEIHGDPESEEPLFVALPNYLYNVESSKVAKRKHGGPLVALVNVSGAIVETDTGHGEIAASEVIAPAIFEAALDENVAAVVLRINSPGGSPVASENILRAIYKVKDKGKPVIVSMGDMAASGGYWVATGADRIFALPTTMTGSIGVVGGKVSAGQLWDKVGVNWDDSIQWGDNAGLWSLNEPFTPSQAERINVMLDDVYEAFTARVAEGRNMTDAQVEAVAQGRVWPGSLALKAGLVDEMGGLNEALDFAAQSVGAADRSGIQVVSYPPPMTSWEMLIDMFSNFGVAVQAVQLQAQMMTQITQPYMPLLQQATIFADEPVLTYDQVNIRSY
jgi:protease-4